MKSAQHIRLPFLIALPSLVSVMSLFSDSPFPSLITPTNFLPPFLKILCYFPLYISLQRLLALASIELVASTLRTSAMLLACSFLFHVVSEMFLTRLGPDAYRSNPYQYIFIGLSSFPLAFLPPSHLCLLGIASPKFNCSSLLWGKPKLIQLIS